MSNDNMGLELLEAFKILSNFYQLYTRVHPLPYPEVHIVHNVRKHSHHKKRRKIFCFKYPNHSRCKQFSMQAFSRNQISCGISLHHSEILSVHDANGNCLSGCTRCKRCMANVLRKVFKPLMRCFTALTQKPNLEL